MDASSGIDEIDLVHTAQIRAIWSPDYHPGNPPAEGSGDFGCVTALNANYRHQIVALTSSFNGYTVLGSPGFDLGSVLAGPTPRQRRRVPYTPKPIQADRLMLSSLGGWLRSRGAWEIDVNNKPTSVVNAEGDALAVSEWVHDAAQGRDHFVRVVKEGSVCFSGHRVSEITETERCFQTVPAGRIAGTPGAYLRQRKYIVIREPEKHYAGSLFDHGGREQPFAQSIRITTLVSPDIDLPSPTNRVPGSSGSYWIMVGGEPFRFDMVGTDYADNRIDWPGALIFVPGDEQNLQAVVDEYRRHPEWRACPVPGQKVAYVPEAGSDNTALVTNAVYFDVKAGPEIKGRFLPSLWITDVQVPAVEQLVGKKAPTSFRFFDGYLNGGLDPQAGVFARICRLVGSQRQDADLPMDFSADKAGGIATPNLSYTSLSRGFGALAGQPGDAALGQFKPNDFFPSNAALLFGTIKLKDLIDGDAGLNGNAPQIVTEQAPPAPAPANEIITRLTWKPFVKENVPLVGPLEFVTRGSELDIRAVLRKPVGTPASGTFTMDGMLTNFTLKFAGVIEIGFRSFGFHAASGAKPAVTVEIEPNGIHFAGDLQFVEQLQEVIPPGVFGEGPSLDLTPTDVRVGYSVGLPPLSVAVFSLQQVKLYAGLTLP